MSNIFIVGYTGATGQELVRQLSQDSPFKSIVLIGRRQAELPVNNDGRFVSRVVLTLIVSIDDPYGAQTCLYCASRKTTLVVYVSVNIYSCVPSI